MPARPPDDPECYRLTVRNLAAVAGNFRAAGAGEARTIHLVRRSLVEERG